MSTQGNMYLYFGAGGDREGRFYADCREQYGSLSHSPEGFHFLYKAGKGTKARRYGVLSAQRRAICDASDLQESARRILHDRGRTDGDRRAAGQESDFCPCH